jgi:hypothetical protein
MLKDEVKKENQCKKIDAKKKDWKKKQCNSILNQPNVKR